jgi:hypothetical protein
VVDGYADGAGRLEVRALGIPLQRQTGVEINQGEALRYLAELPWAPHAMALNDQLEWRELGETALEVSVGPLAVRLDFDAAGDVARASSGMRRYQGRPTPWGGEYSDYAVLGGIRIPTAAEVYWELGTGRFYYWSGRVLSVELTG